MRKSSLYLLGILLVLISALAPVAVLAQEEEGEKIILTQWDGYVSQTPAWEEAISIFQERFPNVEIQRSVQTNVAEILQFAFLSENEPDILFPSADPAINRQWVEAGYLVDLQQFPDWEEFRSTFPNADVAVSEGINMFDGKVISMKMEADMWWHQLYVNLNLYEEAGIVDADGNPILPTRWEELVQNAYTINESTGAFGYGIGAGDTWSLGWQWWICQLSSPAYGWRGFGYDGRVGEFTAAQNDCFKTLVGDLKRMIDDGVMAPNTLSLTDEQIRVMFAEGDVAHILGGVWIIPGFQQTHPDFTNYTSIVVPRYGNDIPQNGYGANAANNFISISRKASQDPAKLEMAWEWVKFLYSEEFGRIWAEKGNGPTIFTAGDLTSYSNTFNAGQFESVNFFRPEPVLEMRNADVGFIEQTLIGPTETDVLIGILSGQIEDIEGALADLDARYEEAFVKALEDAVNAGYNLTREDFIVRDWDQSAPYLIPLTPGYYPEAPN